MISFLFPHQTSPMPVICVSGISPLEVALKFLKHVQPGHRLADCQNAIGHNSKELLLEEVEEIKQEIELPIYDQPLHKEVGGNFKRDEGVALMTRRLLIPKHEIEKDHVYDQLPNELIGGDFENEEGLMIWNTPCVLGPWPPFFFSMKFFSY